MNLASYDDGMPPELVAWVAQQPSKAAAFAECPRADWRVWLMLSSATSEADKRRAIQAAIMCAVHSGVTLRRGFFGQLLRPIDSPLELADRWAFGGRPLLAADWRNDLTNSTMLAFVPALGMLLVLAHRGWSPASYELAAGVTMSLAIPAFARGWRLLRSAINRRRLAHFTFDDAWAITRPLLEPAWRRASPGQRAALMMLTKKSA
jgi:hypothetical protein